MSLTLMAADRAADLRSRAANRLSGGKQSATTARPHAGATDALAVLHALASSPRTAADALALLHELQVHQVELELQAEELQASRLALEAALRQQIDRYDALPVACLGMDAQGRLQQPNPAAARMLALSPDDAGRLVESCLAAAGAGALRQLVSRVAAGAVQASAAVQLRPMDGQPRWASATLAAGPAGQGFLLVLTPTDDRSQRPD
jgi:PAS domain-containing protein